MKIIVMNRTEAVRESYRPGDEAAMISISTPLEQYPSKPTMYGRIKKIMRVYFEDAVPGPGVDPKWLITDNDAGRVAEFARACVAYGIPTLIIHCDAGESRSVAVAMAVQEYFRIPDADVEYRHRMNANPHVYQVMTAALDRVCGAA